MMAEDHIDLLLEHYLGLLDEYTRLRESLSKTQASVFQNIARANFSAERGIRYGPDYYDERMQASRIVTVTTADDKAPTLEVTKAPEPETPKEEPSEDGQEKTAKPKSRDPLRWFGILAPQPLRQAQTHSIHAVDAIIPRLATVDSEMKLVEIEIRRARKKRAKAAAAPSVPVETAEGKNLAVAST